ncbi:MAG: hypothetical protein ACKOBN_02320 [Flavobacteriales bacterium]
MKKLFLFHLFLTLALYFFGGQSAFAQVPTNLSSMTDTTRYIIAVTNGNEYVGPIISQDSSVLVIRTQSLGDVRIQKSDINRLQLYYPTSDDRKYELNKGGVLTTRYLFSSNCFALKKEDNYALLNMYGPEVHFALHRDFSLGVFTTWVAAPVAVALKYTHGTANPKVNYGIQAMFGSLGPSTGFRGYGGLYRGMLTFGDRRSNLTLTAGYFHGDDRGRYYFETIYVPGSYPVVNNQYPVIPVLEELKIGGNTAYVGPVFGIAGQVAINKKFRFIYDCMHIRPRLTAFVEYYGGYQSQYPDYVYNSSGQLVSQSIEISNWNGYEASYIVKRNIFVVMPGFRLEKHQNRALQMSIVGIFMKNINLVIPTVSWYFKF